MLRWSKNIRYLCEVTRGEYRGGNIGLQLIDADGMLFATATVWVEGLAKDEVAIKDYSENTGMLSALLLYRLVIMRIGMLKADL